MPQRVRPEVQPMTLAERYVADEHAPAYKMPYNAKRTYARDGNRELTFADGSIAHYAAAEADWFVGAFPNKAVPGAAAPEGVGA